METENRNIAGVTKMVDAEARTATFIASTATKDRHRTVVNQENWMLDNYDNNPIIGYQHNVYGDDMCQKATPDDIIGKGETFMEDGNLMVRVTFKPEGRSEIADKVFEDVRDGFLRTVSVGFIEIGKGVYGKKDEARGAENETYYFDGQELLEISIVNIPSNPRALKKSFRNSTYNAIGYLMKAFDHKYSYSDLEKMTVGDIMKKLGTEDNRDVDNLPDDVEDKNEGRIDLKRKKVLLAQLTAQL